MTEYDIRQMKQVALVMALTANLNATVAGMVAENQARQVAEQSPAYWEDSFQLLLKESGVYGFNSILGLLNV